MKNTEYLKGSPSAKKLLRRLFGPLERLIQKRIAQGRLSSDIIQGISLLALAAKTTVAPYNIGEANARALTNDAKGQNPSTLYLPIIDNKLQQAAPQVGTPTELSPVVEADTLIEPKTIDGIETFGSIEQPLNQSQFDALVRQENGKEFIMLTDKLYSTIYVYESHVEGFLKSDKSIQIFLSRHARFLSRMLKNTSMRNGFTINRVVILKDGVEVKDNAFLDSDKTLNFFYYNYKQSPEYNSAYKVDNNLIKAWAVKLLGLKDLSDLSFDSPSPSFFEEIGQETGIALPNIWQKYQVNHEYNQEHFLTRGTNFSKPVFSQSEIFYIRMLVKNNLVHDQNYKDTFSNQAWNKDIPNNVLLEFKDETGKKLDLEISRIYLTIPADFGNKYLDPHSNNIDLFTKNFNPSIFFDSVGNNQQLEMGEDVFFILLKDKTGKYYFSWLNMDQLRYAYYLYATQPKIENNNVNVAMTLNAISFEKASKITYESPEFLRLQAMMRRISSRPVSTLQISEEQEKQRSIDTSQPPWKILVKKK